MDNKLLSMLIISLIGAFAILLGAMTTIVFKPTMNGLPVNSLTGSFLLSGLIGLLCSFGIAGSAIIAFVSAPQNPSKVKKLSIAILVLAPISILNGGGFIMGFIISFIGGIFGFIYKPSPSQQPNPQA